jgi:hypothetical protein
MKTTVHFVYQMIKQIFLPLRVSWKFLHWLGVRQFAHRRWSARLPAVLAAGLIATAILPVLGIKPSEFGYILTITLLAMAASVELFILRQG